MANEVLKLAEYKAICSECLEKVEIGDMIMYNTFHKSVRHVKCKKETKREIKSDV
jgi:hypothetical protein